MNEQKDRDLFRSAMSIIFNTCFVVFKSKVMAFIIYHLENLISRFIGYSSFVFYFLITLYYIFIAILIIEYVCFIYRLVFAPLGGYFSYDCIKTFAEILAEEDILISVRNLYTSEPNYEIEFYPLLPRFNPIFDLYIYLCNYIITVLLYLWDGP